MRIAFTGPEGSGKTTVVDEVAPVLGWPKIPELVEETLKSMGLWQQDLISSLMALRAFPNMYFQFQKKLTDAKFAKEQEYASFVEDRTHLDGLAYTLLYLREHVTEDDMKAFAVTSAERCKYDIIFYVPRAEKPLGEGRRITAWGHVATYDFLLRGIYNAYGVHFVQLIQPTIAGRVMEVQKYIELYKEKLGYSSVDR
jgi:predicted ATPase